MADDQEKPIPPEYSKGEQQSPHWSFSFVDLTRIEAGEHIVPAKISGDLACEFAELHMISNDLSFALECLSHPLIF